ncbi:MAG: Xaa-Pro peptidase family protein [Polyangia bacterium]
MSSDAVRRERSLIALESAGLDALVCAHGPDVLLLSGYWPVVGLSFAVVDRSGAVTLLVPEDERELAVGVARVQTYAPGSLDSCAGVQARIVEPLAKLLASLDLGAHPQVGYEHGAFCAPSSYAAAHGWGPSLRSILEQAAPGASWVDATDLLAQARAVLTPTELERVRVACRVAAIAFAGAPDALRLQQREVEVAAALRVALQATPTADEYTRADGHMYCMSGPRSARAKAAYQLSSARRIERGDLALVHCNSYVGGFCTDITRTFSLGAPDRAKREMYAAVLDARAAALRAIVPGARAADVDRAARSVLEARGFGEQFPHSLGHGVGLAAIDAEARPRLHPLSEDLLAIGMVFNVEPAIYVDGVGGLRHCDMVAVGADGPELLTPFLATLEALTVAC